MMERLDRILATSSWCRQFPDFEVNVLTTRRSDHKPLWVKLANPRGKKRPHRSFRYEAAWNLDVECSEVIKLAWSEAEGG